MKVLLMFLIFLFMTGFFIISNNNLALKDEENFAKFVGLYFSWIRNLFNNFITITGNSIGLTWFPENSTVN